MDLKILITDENDDTLYELQIYQDGSDSEGAKEIHDFICKNFDVEQDHDAT